MYRHASMNRIYRLLWSFARSAWIPVAETASARGKSGGSRRAGRSRAASMVKAASAAAGAAALMWGPMAQAGPGVRASAAPATLAGPAGGQIVSGQGTISKSGSTTEVHQSSENLSIDWLSFNVAPNQTVDFLQPNASAIALNRIGGTSGSEILGHLAADGQVYLINPNGVLFGKGSQVNVGGLVASTLDVSDASLSSATRNFAGSGAGSVINEGTIATAPGGYVALLGNHVANQGVITAQLGTVALGAGNALTLSFNGNRLVHLQVDSSVLASLAANGGLIEANGGQVLMTAGARDALLASVVNNSGVIEARTVANHEGTITLLGGMNADTVNVGGTLDASAPAGGNGGFIETSGAHVEVANDARITTAAARGLTGSWLIDPQDFTIAPTRGDITGATLSSELAANSITLESSQGATAGTGSINVNDTVSWSANTLTLTAADNINVNAVMTATGSASLALNPSTANGSATAVAGGTVAMGLTASGFTGMVNFNTTGTLSINGTPYTVINSLGAQGSTTGADLQGMQGNLSGHYLLGSNIDASATSAWNGGAGFAPVGSSSSAPFSGTFDGLGHTIANLLINRSSGQGIGLFGYGSTSATVRNVGLLSDAVTASAEAGGLMGVTGGSVSRSYATGTVTVDAINGGDSGGLVGVSDASATISNAFSTGNVTATAASTSALGGLVGVNFGVISNSFATGAVNGYQRVGGLVGMNDGHFGGNSGTISNSYATGNVGGSSYVGGLVGLDQAGVNTGAKITNSYATGNVCCYGYGFGGLVGYLGITIVNNSYATGRVHGSTEVGGLVGLSYGGGVNQSYSTGAVIGGRYAGGLVGAAINGGVQSSYWNITTSGQSTSAGGTGLTTAQMLNSANFSGFGFTTTPGASGNNWVIVDTDGTLNNSGGATGGAFPMLASEYSTTVNNAHQLQLMAMNPAAVYTLGQNINAAATGSGTDVWTAGLVPIGNASTPFAGTFNGQGHSIGNLTIDLPSASDVGMFGVAGASAVIENVALTGAAVTGAGAVGALLGLDNGGTVSGASAGGTVTGAASFVGGLVGESSGGLIEGSNASVTVSATGSAVAVGGLVGYAVGGVVSNSFATGSVTGPSNSVGGLVGLNTAAVNSSYATGKVSGVNLVGGLLGYSSGAVVLSYATGTVMGTKYLGGLVGQNYGSVSASHATGNVSGSSYVGGLAGQNAQSTGIANSYATGTVTGTSNTVGGLVGASSEPITSSYATGSVTGTSFATGGLVGLSSAAITDSYATGAVSSTGNSVGGLVGLSTGPIGNSYATGTVNGAADVGGLAGYSSGAVTTSYSAGHVTGSSVVGGLVGSSSNSGAVTGSFWDVTTSGQSTSAGGIGMTTANMQQQANFTTATAANGTANPNWDFTNTWVMYNGHTYPLLRAFMTTLGVEPIGGSVTYTGSAYKGSLGVLYSGTPPYTHLYGTLTFNGPSGPAVNSGTYTITPAGHYSDQQGYIITYIPNTVTINPLANVSWVGGTTGNWSNPANWAGGALPDLNNVLAVTIPKGDTVTYDAGMAGLGTTVLSSLTDAGKLVMAAGSLDTKGTLSTAGFNQTGGALTAGTLKITSAAATGVELGDIRAGTLNVISKGGSITELAGATLDVTGATTLTADNGTTYYGITLANAGNDFTGAVASAGLNTDIESGTGNLTLGNTTATGTLAVTALGGAVKQVAGKSIDVAGLVTADGSAITLKSSAALDAAVTSPGAVSLTAAGSFEVSGSIGTTLTTVTTGTGSATSFGDTTVGAKLVVTSTGAVSTLAGDALTVAGTGTTKPNKHVTVNGVNDVAIPVQ